MIDAWAAHRAVARAPWWAGPATALGLALFVCTVGALASAWGTGLAAAVAAGLFGWFTVAVFRRGTWFPVTVPALSLVLAFVGDLAWKYVIEGREKRQVKKLFSRYVAKDVYDQLLTDPSRAALGGRAGGT